MPAMAAVDLWLIAYCGALNGYLEADGMCRLVSMFGAYVIP